MSYQIVYHIDSYLDVTIEYVVRLFVMLYRIILDVKSKREEYKYYKIGQVKYPFLSSSKRYLYIWDFLDATSGIFLYRCFMTPHGGGTLLKEIFQMIKVHVLSKICWNFRINKKDLVTGAARQKLKLALLLSIRSSSAANRQQTALMWSDGSLPLSRIWLW